MRIGDKVTRLDSPAIRGTVISVRDDEAEVYWSKHTTTWSDIQGLTLAAVPHNRPTTRRWPWGKGLVHQPTPEASRNLVRSRTNHPKKGQIQHG